MGKKLNDHEIRLRVDAELYLLLAKGADAEDRPLADFVRRILELQVYGLAHQHSGMKCRNEGTHRVEAGMLRD